MKGRSSAHLDAMSFINYVTNRIGIKVVYFGTSLAGKTSNLKYIARKIDPPTRGELLCGSNPGTIFFEHLRLEAGLIESFNIHFELLACAGASFLEPAQRSVLRGVDGVVFVADSQGPLLHSNVEAFNRFRRHIEALNRDIDALPLVFQYNKRDLEDLIPIEKLNAYLNPRGRLYFESVAIRGPGVFDTLRGIAGLTIPIIRERYFPEEARPRATEAEFSPEVRAGMLTHSVMMNRKSIKKNISSN